MDFQKQKINFSEINGGQRYENGQVLSADTINKTIEAAAYAQDCVDVANKALAKANEEATKLETFKHETLTRVNEAVAKLEAFKHETWVFTLTSGTIEREVYIKDA